MSGEFGIGAIRLQLCDLQPHVASAQTQQVLKPKYNDNQKPFATEGEDRIVKKVKRDRRCLPVGSLQEMSTESKLDPDFRKFRKKAHGQRVLST